MKAQKKPPTKPRSKRAKQKKRRVAFSGLTDQFVTNVPPVDRTNEERLRDQQAALGAMARAIHAQGEREADYTERLNKKYENEPMISEPTWHVHRQH
jgi:hypothetical protein